MAFFLVSAAVALLATLQGTDAAFLLRSSATAAADGSGPTGNATLFPPPSLDRKLSVVENDGFGFVVSQIRQDKAWCLVAADGVANGANLYLQRCDFDGAPSEQLWKFDEQGKLHSHVDETKCMVANFGTSLFNGVRMRMNECDLETDLNTFTLNDDTTDYLTLNVDPSYCVTNRGPSPHPTDTMHAKPCVNRGDYKWSFLPLVPPNEPQLLSYQVTPGVCLGDTTLAIGCSDPSGSAGNPNDLVNCFVAPYTPFDVTHVKFWLNGNNLPLPVSLSVRVWSGTVADGPLVMELDQPLVAASYAVGVNTVALDTPVAMTNGEFCVGVYGGTEQDGFRLDTEPEDLEVSFLLAPTCGVSSFGTMQSIGYDSAFCIEAMVGPSTV